MEGPQKIASKWSAVEPPPPRRIDSQPVKRAPAPDFAPTLVSKHPAPAPAPAPPAELDERVCMLHCEDPPYSAKLLLRGRVLAGPARKVLASFAAGLSKRHPEAGAVDPEALVVTCQGARVYPTYTLDCLDSGVGDLELLVALPAEPEPEPEPEAESSDDDDLPPFEDIAAADDDDDDDDVPPFEDVPAPATLRDEMPPLVSAPPPREPAAPPPAPPPQTKEDSDSEPEAEFVPEPEPTPAPTPVGRPARRPTRAATRRVQTVKAPEPTRTQNGVRPKTPAEIAADAAPGDLRPVAILRPSKPSARMLGPSGRAHVAGLIAVHISSAERIAQCRGMLRSVAAQEIKPVPLVLSWSADDAHAAAFQDMLDSVGAGLPHFNPVAQKGKHSQFEHYELAARELRRLVGDGSKNGSLCFAIFSDDDDIWHPRRAGTFLMAVTDRAKAAPTDAILCLTTCRPDAEHARSAREPRDVDALIRRRHAEVHASDGRGHEFFQFAVELGLLEAFFAFESRAVLASPYCDLRFSKFLLNVTPDAPAFKAPETNWMYFYRSSAADANVLDVMDEMEKRRAHSASASSKRLRVTGKDSTTAARLLSDHPSLLNKFNAHFVAALRANAHVNVLAEGLDMPRDALTTATSHFLTDQAKDVLKTLDRDARDAVNALICDLAEDAVSRFAPGAS